MFRLIDQRSTPLGDLVLRCRSLPGREEPIYEITLDGAFLMSSLVHDSEVALTEISLLACSGSALEVLVGGLGLGWTAQAALDDPRVSKVTVLERLEAVIDWHEQGLVPLGRSVAGDERTHLVEGDVFAWLAQGAATYDALLLDVDHSPRALLDPSHAAFYEVEGLEGAARCLNDGGVLGLWSADAPDGEFLSRLRQVFASALAHEVVFPNPSVNADDLNTIYVAVK